MLPVAVRGDAEAPTGLFRGKVFALTGFSIRQQLEAQIVRHGGSVSRTVHQRVTFLVATSDAVERNTQAVRKARDKFSLPVVRPDFLTDSLEAGKLRSTDEYVPSHLHDAAMSGQRIIRPAAEDVPAEPLDLPARMEVLVDLCGEESQWWPTRIISDLSSSDGCGGVLDIVYEALPQRGYEAASPSRARFDAKLGVLGRLFQHEIADGATGRLYDVEEAMWRAWRRLPAEGDVGGAVENADSGTGLSGASALVGTKAASRLAPRRDFRWKHVIRRELRRSGGVLDRRSLRGVVLEAFGAHLLAGSVGQQAVLSSAEQRRLFRKKLRKARRVIVEGDQVTVHQGAGVPRHNGDD